MSKEGIIELEGSIIDVLPNQTYKVELDNKHLITCYTAGRLKQHRIRLVLGDKVRIEMTPYDLEKGRITYRL
jgi:translation initiation factor IF-1